MKLTMSGEVLSRTLSLQQTVEFTRHYQVKYFELWPQTCAALSDDVHPRLYRNRDITPVQQAFKAAGIQFACVAFGGAFHPEVTQDVDLYNTELIRAVQIAADLGAPFVNHYCCAISPYPDLNLPLMEQYVSRALRQAEKLGVTMVLENEAHDMTHIPEAVLSIIKHFNSPNFRSTFDVTNFYTGGNEAFPHAYQVLKEVIAYVHVKNGCILGPQHDPQSPWVGGKMSGRLEGNTILFTEPFKGAVNITGLMDTLREDGYEGHITLEPHSTLEEVRKYYDHNIPLFRAY